MASKTITVENQDIASIKASSPAQGATSVPALGITFQWVAGNYATNQVYDLSLKKGSAEYSLIASDLSTTSYTYNTALANSSNYTWKLSVKGSDGAVIDFREFTFNTASGTATTPRVTALFQPLDGATAVWLPITLNGLHKPATSNTISILMKQMLAV